MTRTMGKTEFTVIGFWKDNGETFVYHVEASSVSEACWKAREYIACVLNDDIRRSGLESPDEKALMKMAADETAITAVFVGHHEELLGGAML